MTNLTWADVHHRANKIVDILLSGNGYEPLKMYGIPRGGIYAASILAHMASLRDLYLEMVETPEEADIFVDDIIDSGRTKALFKKKYPDIPFFALVSKIEEPNLGWVSFPWERMCQEQGIEDNIVRILEYIGEDPHREGLIDTPKRVVKSYEKLFGGYKQDPKEVLKTFKEGACDEMVLLKNIEFYSTCEHHMLPFYGKAHIAYIPDKRVIGVSKLARVLEIYSRRLQIQERLCQQVTKALDELLQPKGSACVLEAQHFCMTSRGVEKQDSIMVTSSLTGVFSTNPTTRAEFLQLIKGG